MRGRCARVSPRAVRVRGSVSVEVDPAVVDGCRGRGRSDRRSARLSELDRAVVAYVQLLGGLPDRRARRGRVAAYDEQQLVQRGCQARLVGGLLAPAQEAA